MKKIWFRSDDHFNNYNVNKYCNRPFIHEVKENKIYYRDKFIKECDNNESAIKEAVNLTVKEMNLTFIEKWNSKVSPEDTVYYLGDFAFPCSFEEGKKLLNKLNGYKILITGNHDKSKKIMLEMGFNEVYENLEIKLRDQKILLSHYPYIDKFITYNSRFPKKIEQFNKSKPEMNEIICKLFKDIDLNDIKKTLDNYKEYEFKNKLEILFNANLDPSKEENRKYINYRKTIFNILIGTKLDNKGHILLHGHTHSKIQRVSNMINICSDAWDFEMVSEDDVFNLINEYKEEFDFLMKNGSIEKFMENELKYIEYCFYDYKSNDDYFKDSKKIKDMFELFNNIKKNQLITKIPQSYTPEWYKTAIKYNCFLDVKNLEKGCFYSGECRNANVAYWNGTKFLHIRSKFGSEFIEEINHPLNDNGFDLFIPYKKVEMSQDYIDKFLKML